MNKPLDGMRAFLSGPMSDDEYNHVTEFIHAQMVLHELGAAYVYNPAAEWVSEVNRGVNKRSHEYYMRRCVSEISRNSYHVADDELESPPFYDLLVQLDGWHSSQCARTEKIVAESCGIEVVEFSDLPDWIERNGK